MTSKQVDEYVSLLDESIDLLTGGFKRPRPKNIHHQIVPDATSPIHAGSVPQAPGPVAEGPPAAGANAVNSAEVTGGLGRIVSEVADCTLCGLCETRTKTVPGEGAENPLVVIIGEGPGADEDREGRPFIGKAGRYLDTWLNAIELNRGRDCFITNIVKCRPPGNRDPNPDESDACTAYIERQIDLLRPRAILTLGRVAIQRLTGSSRGIGALRGETYLYRDVPVIPTYHPSGVLRNPQYRPDVWDDLRRLKDIVRANG